jgi:DNA-binding LacI/PurR family transcriptional regulator
LHVDGEFRRETGVAGVRLAACGIPPLTSVYQPVERIAALATEALLRAEVDRPWHRVLPTELRVRGSSAG